jgi:TldD protein
MTTSIQIAQQTLLDPFDLTKNSLEKVFSNFSAQHVDYADLYMQSTYYESWSLENGIVRQGSFGIDTGAGFRAISGEKVGLAYSTELTLPALQEAAKTASSIAFSGGNQPICTNASKNMLQLYQSVNPLDSFSDQQKVDLLLSADKYARQDPNVKQVNVSLTGSYETILILTHDNQLIADVRPLVRFNVQVVAERNGRREQGSFGGGGRSDYRTFLENNTALNYTKEAVRQALLNLDAKEAPAGTLSVVLGPGWPGVLLHEAIGHGLEGDFNRRGSSAFSGRIGEQVAARDCTVVDNGTLPNRRGSLNIDDEGTTTQNTVLIENGILKSYLQDKHNAHLMGMESTGNGRRESYAHKPLPRMTNTYMLPGQYTHDEIIASVRKGLYAVGFSGGQVDITSGKFVFSTSEAYMIENGKLTYPVKGATLIGNGPDVLTQVSMIGDNLALDTGIGMCGKDGQSVPVGVGQPTLKVDNLTVGGTLT